MFQLVLLFVSSSFAQLSFPPKAIISYPSIDQTVMISGSFLTDPAIVEAINFVKSKVSSSLLSIPPSVYQPSTPSSPIYSPTTAAANCYWPANQCLRTTDTADFKADIFTCPNAKDWGLTYDDGPSQDSKAGTSQLLAALASANFKSTFFIVGSNAVQFPNVLKQMDAEGHELALQYFRLTIVLGLITH